MPVAAGGIQQKQWPGLGKGCHGPYKGSVGQMIQQAGAAVGNHTRPYCTVLLLTLVPDTDRASLPASSVAPGLSRHWLKSLRHAPNSTKP